jgi:type IV secretion system protein VirB5
VSGAVVGVALSGAPAQAAMPVIDGAAIAQLLVQIEYWKQQIQGMTEQLTQLEETYAAFTGPRGMEQVLALTPTDRNYLPEAFAEMRAFLDGAQDAAGGLGGRVAERVGERAVLDELRLAMLGPVVQELVERARRGAAWSEVVGESAYTAAGARFHTLQELVTTIAAAEDPKAVAELSARIQAEQVMLENEAAKLNALAQSAVATERAERQQLREQIVAGHGVFVDRFQPTPP